MRRVDESVRGGPDAVRGGPDAVRHATDVFRSAPDRLEGPSDAVRAHAAARGATTTGSGGALVRVRYRPDRAGQFNIIDGATAWKVDVIFRKARASSVEEMSRRVPAVVLGVAVFVATAEDTVLAKLEWAKLGESERQRRDVQPLLEAKRGSLDLGYLERWLDALGVRESWDGLRRGDASA
jgi:hypothetical protein